MTGARTQAPFARRLLAVTGNEPLGAYRVLRVRDPDGPRPRPGQFVMIAAAGGWGGGVDERPYLARAFSICRWADAGRAAVPGAAGAAGAGRAAAGRGGEAWLLLEDVGPGTHVLGALAAGEHVWWLGPFGNGFAAPERLAPGAGERAAGAFRALLVGGGVGIAPLVILKDALAERGLAAATSVLLGFRDAARAAAAALIPGAMVATDDGSVGTAGSVLDVLRSELEREHGSQGAGAVPVVCACGPAPMLEAVRALCAEREVACELALEAPMACGFGACYGCVVPKRGGGYLRVCVDGPVVDGALLARVEEHAGALA